MKLEPDVGSAVLLEPGVRMPTVGFGVFQVPPEQTERAVLQALEVGYRHIDTASIYGNEREVGRALAASGLDREEVFVTTKLWNADQGASARDALEASLDRLALPYVDLFLIHWPVPVRDRFVESWLAIQRAQQDGLLRASGVSNFTEEHVSTLVQRTGVVPAVNQVELHPYLAQPRLLEAMHARHLTVTAWSPLAQGVVLDDPTIVAIAVDTMRSPAQIVLRWHLQRGVTVIPKSVTAHRMRENLDVLSFALSSEEMATISALDRGTRTGPDPDLFDGE